ncbi:MAG: hypothetical protein WBC99_07915, partial [Candidatus Omnitrophota bacterium]
PVVEEKKVEPPVVEEKKVEPPVEEKRAEPPVEEKKVEPPVEKEKVPERIEKPKRERKMIPKEVMIDTMKRRLRVFPSIADMIPSLSRAGTTDTEGVEYFYVLPDGTTISLEEVDQNILYNLYVRVNQEATRMHTERILRQIRQQEQLMRLQEQQRMQMQQQLQQQRTQQQQQIQQPPRVYTPPKQPPTPPSQRR